MRKRFLGLLGALCALMLAVGLLPVRALAADGAASYLALGDSVTSGYGLAEGGRAFPDLVAQELGVDYVNAGQPGLTSAELLSQVQDPEMADAITDADVITVTIGGNDLMNALYAYLADVINNDPQLSAELGGAMTPEFVQDRLFDENGMTNRPLINRLMPFIEEFPDSPVFGEALDAFAANLTGIVETINGLNPDVVLVVANQYNPYGHLQDEDLQPLVDAFERCALAACDAVGVVTAERASFADLFPAFRNAEENPCNAAIVDETTVNLDFHPNAYGHELIAQAVVDCAPEHPGLTEDWVAVVEELEALEAGAQATVSIEGNTVVPAAVFKAIAGRDVTVRFELSYDVAWLVNGVDIPTDALVELNLHVRLNEGDVPESAAILTLGYGFMEVAPVFKGDFVYIDEHAYEFLSKSKLYGGEIIISNVGANVGTVFRCPTLALKMSLAPNSIMLRTKGIDDFYYYWFKSPVGQHALASIVTGSAQPKFNKTTFRKIVVPVPPIDTQRKIALFLKSIDNKIECILLHSTTTSI